MIRWDGYSIYHSGTFKIEKRVSRGLTFDANYTWSKSIDDALSKEAQLKESARLQFRVEAFNVFNHTNFADVPGRTAFTSTFGRYTSAENPRQIQLAMKLLF